MLVAEIEQCGINVWACMDVFVERVIAAATIARCEDEGGRHEDAFARNSSPIRALLATDPFRTRRAEMRLLFPTASCSTNV